jgi:hypothetical protein
MIFLIINNLNIMICIKFKIKIFKKEILFNKNMINFKKFKNQNKIIKMILIKIKQPHRYQKLQNSNQLNKILQIVFHLKNNIEKYPKIVWQVFHS